MNGHAAKIITHIVGQVFILHGHANTMKEEEHSVWKLCSMLH